MRLFFFLTIILFLSACVETVSAKSTSNTIAPKSQDKRGLTRIGAVSISNRPKMALVIGNSRYEYGPLQNTINDANDLAQVLTDIGFQVILKTNLNQKEMDRALKEFGQRVKDHQGIGLFYFSGHGARVEGQNYLIPIDNNRIQGATDLKYYAIDTDKILNTLETGNNHLNVVILDACRNNPYQSQGKSLSRGLAWMQSVSSSIIAFATSPGKSASDASLGGRNGLYTKYLIDGLKKAHQNRQRIDDMFMQVTKAVVEESGGEQKPWYSASLMEPFCFGGCQITIQSTTTMQVSPNPKQEHSAPQSPAIPPPAPVPITPPPAPVPSTPPPVPVTTTPSSQPPVIIMLPPSMNQGLNGSGTLSPQDIERLQKWYAMSNSKPTTSTSHGNTKGLYPQASTRLLTHNDLVSMSKWQLKIMRNEIFARHGYIFKTAAMKSHFNKQPWYQPKFNDVSHLLTPIESENIKLIQRYEK